ncbi:MAG: tRNA (guanosine(46)-N7)-methyltransferase TrmB [Lachnospiraceae bacterium]|nr:tRNA (guanosine(46)-N7)-methyltransferase TrmB [Lachnospiraceae bacterium]
MRLRNIPGARDEIVASPYTIKNPEEYKGRWTEYFGNDHPIHLEIGTGKGKFIIELAKRNPDINYIGIEKFSSVLIRALAKQEEEELENLIFIRFDADEIENIFDKDEIDRIYLNFSDPWPKDRHAKRRLTSDRFLGRYINFLKSTGRVEFKTDNRDLFDYSLETAKEAGWEVKDVTYDLHSSEWNEGNIMTEYEERFSAQGNPIFRMVECPPSR